jgi:DNA-binding NarL/FixJ family response regulator
MTPEPIPVRVILADDHAIVREGLRQVLEDIPGVAVVGQAASGTELLALAVERAADVVVLDWSMPGTDAPALITRLRRDRPALKVLVLTVHENVQYALRALECGAHGYVVKAAAVRDLVEAIRRAVEGEVYVSPGVAQRLLARIRSRGGGGRRGLEGLSPRELELLHLLASGLSLKECAARLGVGVSTASTYRARLLEKLGLRTTPDIIRFALVNRIGE